LSNSRRLPYNLVEAPYSAVQMIFAVVLRELVFDAVQREPALRDAVTVAPNQSAEVGAVIP
jgi:hypothetical protein